MTSRSVAKRRSPLRRVCVRLELLEGRSLLSADLGLNLAASAVVHPDLTVVPLAVGPAAGTATPLAGTATSAPYTPSQIRHAYGVDQLTQDGTGQTIAIIDAYNDPTIASDLAYFDNQFGLATANLSVVYTQGTNATTTAPTNDSGWSGEIALDVEWAHVIAPKAKIMLVEAASSSFTDLVGGAQYAAAHGANVVSMSWGGGDSSYDSQLDASFKATGVSYFASSGDSGAGVSYPASSPNVVGVGGTYVSLDSQGNKLSESAWSGSGGGTSAYETRPSYQSGFQSASNRGVPDVSYNADPNSGVYVYNGGQWEQVGGTSAGAPQWAALAALVNQGRQAAGLSPLGNGFNTALYALAGKTSYTNSNGDFADVTTGSSSTNGSNQAIPATTGYDTVTGLGSPVANKLVPDLIKYGTTTTTTTTTPATTTTIPTTTPTRKRWWYYSYPFAHAARAHDLASGADVPLATSVSVPTSSNRAATAATVRVAFNFRPAGRFLAAQGVHRHAAGVDAFALA